MSHHPDRRFAVRPGAIAAALVVQLGSAQALPVTRATASSSCWDLAANWNARVLPEASDDVSVTLAGTRTVTYRQNVSTTTSLAPLR